MAGAWTKITVKVDTKNIDKAADIISMLDNGVMIEDFSDFSLNGMYGELVDESILNADKTKAKASIFVPDEKELSSYIEYINKRLPEEGISYEISLLKIEEDSWADSWKKYFEPIREGRLTVAPSWEEYPESESELVVRIDPGMAFGTGAHETTRLVMRLMQEEISHGDTVLDLGCGSGILSICAAKLGAGAVYGYDIDPVAVRVSRENAEINGADNITFATSDLLKSVKKQTNGYDVCVANIVSEIIIRMLPDISDYLKPCAPIILSGIVKEKRSEVLTAASKLGFALLGEASENDWVALKIARAQN